MNIPLSKTQVIKLEPREARKHARIGTEKTVHVLSFLQHIRIFAGIGSLVVRNGEVKFFYHAVVNGAVDQQANVM
jgi:hypothetical protein